MIPILYPHDETLFVSNGLGRLTDCISCEVTEERNGIFECEFVYPITGAHYSDIQNGCLIFCTHDDSGRGQPFEIYKSSAAIDGLVTFNAHHISYRLSNVIVKPFTMSNGSVQRAFTLMKMNSVGIMNFNLYTDKGTTGDYKVTTPDSFRSLLGGISGSILDVFGGGEYKWDRFSVTLYEARGVDNGVSIRYGKNLTDITADRSIEGRYTGVVPFWADDGGQLVTLPEWYIMASASVVNAADWTNEAGNIITDENRTPIEFGVIEIALAPMDLSDQWEEPPAVAELRNKATSKLAASKAWETDENIDVDFVALWQTPEYENVAALQRVALCDTVRVYYPALGVETTKKVIKTVYNPLLDRYNSIELGKAKTSFAEVIKERTVDVMSGYVKTSKMQAAIENATQLIQGGLGGYVVMNTNADGQPEEILVMDTDDMNTAVNVIRINKNGIGFSTSGYQGPFRNAWTIDGHLVADFIDTGNLNANLITTGHLSGNRIAAGIISALAGGSSWNLNTGDFISDNGTRSTRISGGNVSFYYGDTRTGYIAPFYWSNDNQQEGVVLLATEAAKYLGIGRNGSSLIVINNGLNPGGVEESTIFMGTVNFRQGVTFAGKLLPSADVSASCSLGSSSLRFYQVWTSSLNFATGAYINYNATSDRIYASKTITQGSDEKLKNLYPYDDRYDALLDVLEPVLYTWKDHPDGARYVGLGARKTAALLDMVGIPDSGFVGIGTDDKGAEVYGVDYNELAVMLLHKVQKQQAEINDLKNQIETIMKRLEELEGKNANP